jgi:hypothetical protein
MLIMSNESAIMEFAHPASAAVLEPSGVHSRTLDLAMEQVSAALSKGRSSSNPVYGVLVYGKHHRDWKPNYLAATGAFLKAYLLGFKALPRFSHMITTHLDEDHVRTLEAKDLGVRLFLGKATARHAKKMKPSLGIYILSSHLDDHLLKDLGLPLFPKRLREIPFVIQVESSDLSWEKAAKGTAEDPGETATDKDTLAWRRRFMSENECLTSQQIAHEGTSRAANSAAMASRWAKDKKVFSVRFEGQQWFPRFQFQDGRPIPAVSQVIEVFPEQTTGWELAYFFVTPNSYLGGGKPVDLLRTDPVRLASLAQAFVRPVDVF